MVAAKYRDAVMQVKGVEEAQRILQEYLDKMPEILSENYDELGRMIVQAANARTPIKTGRLVSGNKVLKVSDKGLWVGNRVPYSHFVHNGTSRMPARPFFLQPVQMARDKFPKLMVSDCTNFYKDLVSRNKPR